MNPIPTRLEELTPAWVTNALRARGLLGDGLVRSAPQQVLGEGEGFLGAIARLQLDYEGDASNAPTSLVAKLPTPVAENRTMGEVLGAYWREIHFYEEMSGDFPVRVPAVYWSDLTPDPMRERQDDIVAKLDKLPTWLVSTIMFGAGLIVKRNAHRYALLIEDLAPASAGDQLAGADADTCGRVLDVAATLHAHFWQKPILKEHFWLARQDVGPRFRHRMYWNARKNFRKRYPDLIQGERTKIVDWLDRNSMQLSHSLHPEAPQTLIHCDLRFDNIFFTPEGKVILGDWQLVGVGAAAYDIAYLISSALHADAPAEEEERLLRGYHAALEARGVSDYPFERFQRDYWRGLFAVLQILATTNSVDLSAGSENRGDELMHAWTDRALTLLSRAPLERVL